MRFLNILTLTMISLSGLSSAYADYHYVGHSMQQFQSSWQATQPLSAIDHRYSGNATERSKNNSINSSKHNTAEKVVTEKRQLAAFTQIELQIPAQVIYQQDQEQKVELTAEARLLDILTTEVIDGVLVISASDSFSTTQPMKLALSSEHLEAVIMNAPGKIELAGIHSDQLYVKLNGSGTLKLTGNSRVLKSDLVGSGFINAENLRSEQCRINLQGSGLVQSRCRQHISAHLLGSGVIAISGSPNSRQLSGWGAGDIQVN